MVFNSWLNIHYLQAKNRDLPPSESEEESEEEESDDSDSDSDDDGKVINDNFFNL